MRAYSITTSLRPPSTDGPTIASVDLPRLSSPAPEQPSKNAPTTTEPKILNCMRAPDTGRGPNRARPYLEPVPDASRRTVKILIALPGRVNQWLGCRHAGRPASGTLLRTSALALLAPHA